MPYKRTSERFRIEEARRMGWVAWTWQDEYTEERKGITSGQITEPIPTTNVQQDESTTQPEIYIEAGQVKLASNNQSLRICFQRRLRRWLQLSTDLTTPTHLNLNPEASKTPGNSEKYLSECQRIDKGRN